MPETISEERLRELALQWVAKEAAERREAAEGSKEMDPAGAVSLRDEANALETVLGMAREAPALFDEIERLRGEVLTQQDIALKALAREREYIFKCRAAEARVKELEEQNGSLALDVDSQASYLAAALAERDAERTHREILGAAVDEARAKVEALLIERDEQIAAKCRAIFRAAKAEAERDAALAKLAEVREWAEREKADGDQCDCGDEVLAILGPQPARATADEDARGEKEPGVYFDENGAARVVDSKPTMRLGDRAPADGTKGE